MLWPIQVAFLSRYANAVIERVKPLRRRRSAGQLVAAGGLPAPGMPRPDCPNQQRTAPHVLVNMGEVASQARKAKAEAAHRPVGQVPQVSSCRGLCALDGCLALPKRPQYRCLACNDGDGAYYHLECFFKRHPHVGAPLP